MKPYSPPADRKRMMKPAPSVPGESSPPSSGAPTPSDTGDAAGTPERGDGEASGNISAFVPKEVAMGRDYKPGDKIEMIVKAVDPDTGEMEIACDSSDNSTQKEGPSVSGMDGMGAE